MQTASSTPPAFVLAAERLVEANARCLPPRRDHIRKVSVLRVQVQ
jgi:hypothetical protein